ncbi:sensor histidine kinase [Stenomitos frigidus]|uniref:histidine kinase n=1 Tax=Stenomitos frigidus ULC18 TaxID=2107698 RepID=A0A2T1EHP9_9CYAN|nr:HAMP domain-containing sensor histidine kinase [Stenomitos frigidus]PSB32208.1 two-component sensor histidine kinase [Stenomitos frigidus ULC18]
MKLRSVSSRLTLTLLLVTLGSLFGFSLILGKALEQFFVKEAEVTLRRQADALATQVPTHWDNALTIRQLTDLMSEQARSQVTIFNTAATTRLTSQGVNRGHAVVLPNELIRKTLAGSPQAGRLWIATDPKNSWWLYSTVPLRHPETAQIVGAVYLTMPLRRPKRFAEEVQGLVMGMAIAATTVAAATGFLLSRTLTRPLRALHRQAQRLEAGDYEARSALKGHDELAQLSHLLDQMAAKLMETLSALQAQETARRELVANVSHDLRTPLAVLRVELEAILDGVVTGEKAQLYLQRACYETDYLTRLVEQLLLLAKADAGQLQIHPQVVSATAIAQECLSRMQPSATQAGLTLELAAASTKAAVWVDPELTGQVVLNLLDNAIKYAPESEVVCLKVLPPMERDRQHYIPLQIQDQGKGIEANVLQRLTERFYRGDNARPRGGMGLGLAIAQHVCHLQGGMMHIKSQVGQGTVVTLLLPVAAG